VEADSGLTFPAPPAMMGYDRTTAMFSPDGRLFQVEYAFEAVKRGWTTVGVRVKDGVVIAAEKRKGMPLMDIEYIEKVYKVDEHIGAGFVGFGSDGRVLIDYARLLAVEHKFAYGEPIPVEYLIRQICDVMQLYTQHAGVRPFGVAIIIGGVDSKGPALYVADPSGQYFSYKAVSYGQGSGQANEILVKGYRDDMSLNEAVLLAIKAIAATMEGKPSPENLEIGIVDAKTKTFRKFSREEIEALLSRL